MSKNAQYPLGFVLYTADTFMSLQIEIMEPVDVATDKGNVYSVPKSSAVLIPESFDGRSTCLLEWCNQIKGRDPKTVLFITKTGVCADKKREGGYAITANQ